MAFVDMAHHILYTRPRFLGPQLRVTYRPATSPFKAVKARMFSALLVTTTAIAVGGGLLALLVGVQPGVDLFLGGLVVILPQSWLAYQLGSQRWSGKPGMLGFRQVPLGGSRFCSPFCAENPN